MLYDVYSFILKIIFILGYIYLNNVLEPGESYELQKMIEFDGKCFLFLLRNN